MSKNQSVFFLFFFFVRFSFHCIKSKRPNKSATVKCKNELNEKHVRGIFVSRKYWMAIEMNGKWQMERNEPNEQQQPWKNIMLMKNGMEKRKITVTSAAFY